MELMTETLEKPLDSNYFEELVDKMVLDGIPGITQEFIDKINDLPKSQKRMAILSILDKDLNLFRRIKALTDQNINKMEHVKDIILMLREYVKVGEIEKKKFGEVMTPLDLVKEMLNTLPEEVWSDPHLKWLDPANGTGPYPLMVIYKLMNGLKEWEPDDERRYKHIVENMIYVCEIQPKNMFLYLCAVDPFDKYNLNIYTGSFLEEGFDKHMTEVWGLNNFNLIIGNPPFNQMIDIDFVHKGHNISNILLFIHPSTWLLDKKNKQRKFLTIKNKIGKDLISIKLFNANRIFNIFLFVPCVITYCNKNLLHDKIKCIDKINDIEIDYTSIDEVNKYSNLDEFFTLKEKITLYAKEDNFMNHKNVESGNYFVNLSQIRGNVQKNSQKSMIKSDFYTLVTKNTIVSNKKSKHMFFSFETKNEAENFLGFIKTNFCRFCLSIFKNNSQLDRGELEIIPWLDFKKGWNEQELSVFFDLTSNEINFINRIIPKYYD